MQTNTVTSDSFLWIEFCKYFKHVFASILIERGFKIVGLNSSSGGNLELFLVNQLKYWLNIVALSE